MLDGFFNKKETQSESRPDGKTYSCISCGLYKNCNSPKMQPYGNFKKKIMIIGEHPTDRDDRVGKLWQDKTGRLLQTTLKSFGVDIFEDCISLNAVNCMPFENHHVRWPSNYEIDCCRKIVLDAVSKYKPHIIILLGTSAVYSIIGHRWKRDFGTIIKWRGWNIPDKDFDCWVCPTYSPGFIFKSEQPEATTVWNLDLKQSLSLRSVELPKYKEPEIKIIDDLLVLNEIPSGLVAIDYETTGIKPHAPGHKLVCAAVATSPDFAYVFMLPGSKIGRQPFKDLLARKDIGKIAQNMKFEDTWSVVRLNQQVENWVWDTMLATHILDNRPGITSLKFQTYVQFGIVDYESEIGPYLKSVDSKNGNSLNRILSFLNKPRGKQKLLTYCGLDTIYEYRLAMLQMKLIYG